MPISAGSALLFDSFTTYKRILIYFKIHSNLGGSGLSVWGARFRDGGWGLGSVPIFRGGFGSVRGVASVGPWGGKWVRGLDWERWGLVMGAARFVSGSGRFGGASDSDGEWLGCAVGGRRSGVVVCPFWPGD